MDITLDELIAANRVQSRQHSRVRSAGGRGRSRGTGRRLRSRGRLPTHHPPQLTQTHTETKLYISNLHFQLNDQDLKNHFSRCAGLKSCTIHYHKDGRSKGTAVAVFARKEDAVWVMQMYNNQQLRGRALKIEPLVKRDPPQIRLTGNIHRYGDAREPELGGQLSTAPHHRPDVDPPPSKRRRFLPRRTPHVEITNTREARANSRKLRRVEAEIERLNLKADLAGAELAILENSSQRSNSERLKHLEAEIAKLKLQLVEADIAKLKMEVAKAELALNVETQDIDQELDDIPGDGDDYEQMAMDGETQEDLNDIDIIHQQLGDIPTDDKEGATDHQQLGDIPIDDEGGATEDAELDTLELYLDRLNL